MKSKHLQPQDSSGYSTGPPWLFSGRAFYQLHLVKADVAKRFIPSDLKIVQAFGYTLGGLYLAQYDSSPAGTFDELVVIAGTVWNPPTSCAWAARVLVNSRTACDHGKKEVGLPSKLASFSQVLKPVQKRQGWWRWNPLSKFWSGQGELNIKRSAIDILETDGPYEKPLCQILFPSDRTLSETRKQWHGPSVSMSLPSFSGRTREQPYLLKYSCQLKCSVKAVKPATITTPLTDEVVNVGGQEFSYMSILAILAAKPLFALCFENMIMHVEAAKIVDRHSSLSHKITPERRATSPVSAKTL